MAQCYHFEGVNNPLDKDADGGMTHDNILRPDWHKGKDLPVNHTSNMSKQITWATAIVPAQGFLLQNYLNMYNFQPGKFFVILDGLNYQVFYVVKENK